jgi:hypothetical protein
MQLAKDKAEGVVWRDMRAAYKQGRAGQHFKTKFVKECDVVVMGPSPKDHNSVEIGVFDKGILRRVSGLSLNGKTTVVTGDVVQVHYLYASKNLHLVQPCMASDGARTDKQAADCTIDQLVVNKNWV